MKEKISWRCLLKNNTSVKASISDNTEEIELRLKPFRKIKVVALKTDGSKKPYYLEASKKEKLQLS